MCWFGSFFANYLVQTSQRISLSNVLEIALDSALLVGAEHARPLVCHRSFAECIPTYYLPEAVGVGLLQCGQASRTWLQSGRPLRCTLCCEGQKAAFKGQQKTGPQYENVGEKAVRKVFQKTINMQGN